MDKYAVQVRLCDRCKGTGGIICPICEGTGLRVLGDVEDILCDCCWNALDKVHSPDDPCCLNTKCPDCLGTGVNDGK